MTLTKQLWLAILVTTALAFGGSLVVSVLSASQYLEQELNLKNNDNATALALTLTRLEKDPVTIELQVAAQFDAGHYRAIRVLDPEGRLLTEKTFRGPATAVPEWFTRLIPIHARPGRALIQDGWKQFGSVVVDSHDAFAYQSLWNATAALLAWFALGGLAAGAIGSLGLRLITRPLRAVVAQADGISARQFQTVPEPRTPELRSVVRAMNDMVARLKRMFGDEAVRLEQLRLRVNRDAVTGLANREHFLSHLQESLGGEQSDPSGSLVLVRLTDLAALNASVGRPQADALLQRLGAVLRGEGGDGRSGPRAGRLNGAEFAVVFPSAVPTAEAVREIHTRLLQDWLPAGPPQVPDLFHVAGVGYRRGQSLGELLSRADEALARATSSGPNGAFVGDDVGIHVPPLTAEQWRGLFAAAAAGGRWQLSLYPVVAVDGHRLLHREAMIRLRSDPEGALLPAGDFMPMAAHLNLTGPIDLGALHLAIDHLRSHPGDVAVNLSAETIVDFNFRNGLAAALGAHPDACPRLLFEVPEYGAFRHFDAFRDLARYLKSMGCRVGIEYFGPHFADSNRLPDVGLDYVKVHPSYVRGIAARTGNQEFLAGLCKFAHAMGIQVMALGVESAADLVLLQTIGFDGATGPGIGALD